MDLPAVGEFYTIHGKLWRVARVDHGTIGLELIHDRLDRKPQFRPPLVQRHKRTFAFQPRKLIAETEMDPRAERHVVVRSARARPGG